MAQRKTPRIETLNADQAKPAPIVLISGKEEFLASRAVQSVKSQLREREPNLEVHELRAAEVERGELLTVASPSLFAEPRLVVISGFAEANDAVLADLPDYLRDPPADVTLVVLYTGGQRGRSVLASIRQMREVAIEIVCDEVTKDNDRIAFARSEFQRLGATATPGAARAISLAYSGTLGELAAACAQLVADHGNRVTEETVLQATEGRTETTGFKIADAAAAGREDLALTLLRHALIAGTSPVALVVALNMKLRAIARVYGAGGSNASIAQSFKMQAWQVDRARKEAQGWRESDLAGALDLAAATEWNTKGGSRDPDFAVERLVRVIARKGKIR